MSESIRVTLGIASFIVGMVCAIASTFTQTRMVAEVNAQLPTEARFAVFGWHPAKTMRLFREYQRLCPSGMLLCRLQWLVATVFLTLGGVAAVMGLGLGGFIWFAGAGSAWAWFMPKMAKRW